MPSNFTYDPTGRLVAVVLFVSGTLLAALGQYVQRRTHATLLRTRGSTSEQGFREAC